MTTHAAPPMTLKLDSYATHHHHPPGRNLVEDIIDDFFFAFTAEDLSYTSSSLVVIGEKSGRITSVP